MNKLIRTQGPWSVKQLSNYSDPGWVILWPDKGGTHMRRLDYAGNFTEADARVIAAAPELLEALQEVLSLARRNAPELSGKAFGRADAAIAKATEGTP